MVSFVCNCCQNTVKKPKVPSHLYSCYTDGFSCIDCGEEFNHETYKNHNQCISEAEKYQGKLYRGPKTKQNNNQQPQQQQQQQQKQQPKQQPAPVAAKEEKKESEKEKEDSKKRSREEEKEVEDKEDKKKKKKSKDEEAPAPASSSSSSSTTVSTTLDSLLASSTSLKKVIKSVRKTHDLSKESAVEQIWTYLQENAENISIKKD